MKIPTLIAAPTLLLALAACAANPQDPGSQPADDDHLGGRTFVARSVTVDGDPRPLVDGTRLVLGFDGDAMSVDAGCNHLFGNVAYADDVLRVGHMGGTEMGCDRDRMDQDTWVTAFLSADPRYELDGDGLALTGGNTVIELVDQQTEQPDATLVGTAWRLEAIVAGSGPDGTVSTVPGGLHPRLSLTRDGWLTAGLGCNSGGGRVEVEADTLQLRRFASTLMLCRGGPPADVQRLVLRVLRDGEIGYVVRGETLTLTRGEHGLVYRAA